MDGMHQSGPKTSKWQNWDLNFGWQIPCSFYHVTISKVNTRSQSRPLGYMMTESVSQVCIPELCGLICFLASADHGEQAEGRVPGEGEVWPCSLMASLYYP